MNFIRLTRYNMPDKEEVVNLDLVRHIHEHVVDGDPNRTVTFLAFEAHPHNGESFLLVNESLEQVIDKIDESKGEPLKARRSIGLMNIEIRKAADKKTRELTYALSKKDEDVLMCEECGKHFTRKQAVDATGDDKQCPACDAELFDFDGDEDEKSKDERLNCIKGSD